MYFRMSCPECGQGDIVYFLHPGRYPGERRTWIRAENRCGVCRFFPEDIDEPEGRMREVFRVVVA